MHPHGPFQEMKIYERYKSFELQKTGSGRNLQKQILASYWDASLLRISRNSIENNLRMGLLLTGGKRYGHGITALGDVYLEEICVYDASGTFIRNKSEQQPAIPPIRGICRISVEIQPTEHRIETK